MTEFNLYGVPWQRLDYRGGMQQAAASEPPATVGGQTTAVRVEAGNIVQAETNRYTRTLTVTIADYTVAQVESGDVTYDVLSIAGGDKAIAPALPLLPYVRGYTLTLPITTISRANQRNSRQRAGIAGGNRQDYRRNRRQHR